MKNQSNTQMEGKHALLVTPCDGVIMVTHKDWDPAKNRYIAHIKDNGKPMVSKCRTIEDVAPLIAEVVEHNADLRRAAEEPDDFDDSMDGDHDSAMASAGHGTDEDYGGGMEHL